MAGRGERRLRCFSAPGAVPCSPTAEVFIQGKHGLCLPQPAVQRVCTSRAGGLTGTLSRAGEQRHFALWLPAQTFPRHGLLAEGSARAPGTATSQERL